MLGWLTQTLQFHAALWPCRETGAIDDLLANARDHGDALVLLGEPGIGDGEHDFRNAVTLRRRHEGLGLGSTELSESAEPVGPTLSSILAARKPGPSTSCW